MNAPKYFDLFLKEAEHFLIRLLFPVNSKQTKILETFNSKDSLLFSWNVHRVLDESQMSSIKV
jgi:hypothetical protein